MSPSYPEMLYILCRTVFCPTWTLRIPHLLSLRQFSRTCDVICRFGFPPFGGSGTDVSPFRGHSRRDCTGPHRHTLPMKKVRSRVDDRGARPLAPPSLPVGDGAGRRGSRRPLIGVVIMECEHTPFTYHDFQSCARSSSRSAAPRSFGHHCGVMDQHEPRGMRFSLLSRVLIADTTRPWSMACL